MKKLIIAIMVTLFSLSASAMNIEDVAGTYEITTEVAPVSYLLKLSAQGEVELTEYSPYTAGPLVCLGYAQIFNNTLESDVLCENDLEFTQRVNLAGITNLNEFVANVYSSKYGFEAPMSFTKLD